MASLEELYFSLGLDDKEFNNALEAAKKQVATLEGNVNVKIKVDTSELQESLAKLSVGAITPKMDKSVIESQIADVSKQLENLEVKIGKTKTASEMSPLLDQRSMLEKEHTKLQGLLSSASDTLSSEMEAIKIKLELPSSETDKIRKQLKTSLANSGVDITINPKVAKQNIRKTVKEALNGLEQKVSIKPEIIKKNLKKVQLEANKTVLRKSVIDALKNERFKAKLDLVVEKAEVQEAIRKAFEQASLQWNTTASDVRAARVREIDTRTASRELLDQEKLNQLRNRGLDSSSEKANRLLNLLTKGSTWATGLNNQIGNAFSIYAIQRFVRSLYTVGGEFQKQQIALQNMIGDANKANAIFERMKELAVVSPFKFSELASYTKQMSAYGVEYDELYETTKRLADISAGVGVDMSRIILAYGQVRSAEVLRGQELRQFTEAGIPIVAELAKRLEEVRGKSVAIGEVFDAISKREISFGMVKDVLFDMTDPGGRFFETQERLAESLAGRWSNLQDAWDIMIADIANGNNTVLAKSAEIMAWLVKNWEAWLPLIAGATVALGSFRAVMSVIDPLQTAFQVLLGANPWIALGSAIAGIGAAIYGYVSNTEDAVDAQARLNSELEKETQILKERETSANRYLDILERTTDNEAEKVALQRQQQAALDELVEMYGPLFENMQLEKLTLEEIAKKRKKINEATEKGTIESYKNNKAQLVSLKNSLERELSSMEKTNQSNKNPLIDSEFFKKLGSKFNEWFGASDDDIRNKKAEIANITQAISDLDVELENLAKTDAWDKAVKALTPDSSLEEYIYAFGEIGKAVKVLRQAGVTGALANPQMGTDLIDYYDKLNAALKEQESITKKFDPSSDAHKKALKQISVYKSAISAIKGIWETEGGKTDAASKAGEEAAKAFAESVKLELEKIASQWDLYNQLFELTGSRAFSMTAFQITPVWDEASKQMLDKFRDAASSKGIDWDIDFDISDSSAKAIYGDLYDSWRQIKDRIEKNGIDLKLNAANAIKESRTFEMQIDEVDRKLQKTLKSIEVAYRKDTPIYEKHAAEAIRRAEEEKTKIRFEEFKNSSDWVKVFDDLNRVSDSTLDDMTTKIEEYAKQANLSEEVTKQLVVAMRKLREESIERNPFKSLVGHISNLSNVKKINDNLYRIGSGTEKDPYQFKNKKDIEAYLAEERSGLNKSQQELVKKFDAAAQAAGMVGEMLEYLGSDALSVFASVLGNITQSAGQASNFATTIFGEAAGPWGAVAGAVIGAVTSAFAQVDKNLQREIEASERREKEIGYVAQRLEKALERNMGGMYTIKLDNDAKSSFNEVVGDFNKLQSSLNAFGDGKLNWDILNTIRELNHLQNDTIETIKEALTDDSYYDAQLAALKIQRDEVKKQMDLEDEKKKTNESKMLDYKNQIAELDDSIKHFAEDMADALYGIDFKDWANQLAETLVDAWASGEDAVQAYKEKVNDILKDLGVSIISQKILEPLMTKTMDEFLAQFDKDNGVLTDSSLKILAGMAEGAELAASATDAYLEGLKKLGIDLSETSDGTKDGLTKGIQSVTEDTANLLGSYLNSIRQSVHIKQQLLEKLASQDIPKINHLAEAQLRELSQIQANTAKNVALVGEIKDLVNRVVDKGSNKLKV